MIFVVVILQHIVHSVRTLAPPVVYESYGPNQIVKDEGSVVLTPSGRGFVVGVTLQECARLCWRQDKCSCCNAFTYRLTDQRCYLKSRADNAIDMPYTDPDNFQTFKFYPLQNVPFYDGDLPESVNVERDLPYFAPFQSFYSTQGEGKIALNEGTQILANGQPSFQNGLSASMCATACETIQGCLGFSYNPSISGGQCYFKTDIPEDSKYVTKNSDDGWTFYWKEANADKCYCSCKSQFTCLHCYEGSCCEIEGKLTC